MRYQRDSKATAVFLKGPECRRVTTLAAGRVLAKARGLVGHATAERDPHRGATAASGRLVHGIGGIKNDRVRVSVVFGGAAVQQQFGNRRTKASRFLTRALSES